MMRYIATRLLSTLPVLLLVSVLVFLMLHLVPGDPVHIMLDESGASVERVEQIRTQLGLNYPLPMQYGRFVRQLVTGEVRSIR